MELKEFFKKCKAMACMENVSDDEFADMLIKDNSFALDCMDTIAFKIGAEFLRSMALNVVKKEGWDILARLQDEEEYIAEYDYDYCRQESLKILFYKKLDEFEDEYLASKGFGGEKHKWRLDKNVLEEAEKYAKNKAHELYPEFKEQPYPCNKKGGKNG